jgi:uncharacterized delta-60 repeat protein
MRALILIFAIACFAANAQSIAPYFEAHARAVQPDGKIVLAGTSRTNLRLPDGVFAVQRRNPDDSVDASFGDGLVRVEIFGYLDTANAIAFLPDGSMVIGGNATDPSRDPNCYYLFCGSFPALVKLRPDGTLDPTFNGKGKVVLEFAGYIGQDEPPDWAYLTSLRIEPDGKIMVVTRDGRDGVRINPNGLIDLTYVTSRGVETVPKTEPAPGTLQGLWWGGVMESGWNLNISHQGDTLFVTWATYDALGQPTWLSMSATQVTAASYSGKLYSTHGPGFAQLYDPSRVSIEEAGTATLTFSGTDNGRFDYDAFGIARSKEIVRYQAGAPQLRCRWNALANLASAVTFQDLWYADPAGSQPGWAVGVADAGYALLFTWLTYDANGAPTWFFGTSSTDRDFEGSLFRATGPSFTAPSYDPGLVALTRVGRVEVDYRDHNHMGFYTTVNGISQAQEITRYVFRGNGTACELR